MYQQTQIFEKKKTYNFDNNSHNECQNTGNNLKHIHWQLNHRCSKHRYSAPCQTAQKTKAHIYPCTFQSPILYYNKQVYVLILYHRHMFANMTPIFPMDPLDLRAPPGQPPSTNINFI